MITYTDDQWDNISRTKTIGFLSDNTKTNTILMWQERKWNLESRFKCLRLNQKWFFVDLQWYWKNESDVGQYEAESYFYLWDAEMKLLIGGYFPAVNLCTGILLCCYRGRKQYKTAIQNCRRIDYVFFSSYGISFEVI